MSVHSAEESRVFDLCAEVADAKERLHRSIGQRARWVRHDFLREIERLREQQRLLYGHNDYGAGSRLEGLSRRASDLRVIRPHLRCTEHFDADKLTSGEKVRRGSQNDAERVVESGPGEGREVR